MPTIRYTPAEDAEIIRLKENVGKSWSALAQAFNARFTTYSRSQTNLQVRYCRYLALKNGGEARANALRWLATQQPPVQGMCIIAFILLCVVYP
jgi:predicted chitinase